MARKKKIKIKGIVITKTTAILMAVVLALGVVTYFVYEPFRKQVDKFFDYVFSTKNNALNTAKGENELRFHMIDVGQGDSLFIEFPDSTVMLIDTAEEGDNNDQKIINYIKSYGHETIDYFMLTHTDSDHISHTKAIASAFVIKNAFIPNVENKDITQTYHEAYDALLGECGKNLKNSYEYMYIASTDPNNLFFVAFLSPWQSLYDKLNNATIPTPKQKNDVSPLIYIEYMQKRILLTGDANIAVEDEVINRYNNKMFENFAVGNDKINVNLSNIDILKVGHHGSAGSSGEKLLGVTRPKYSLISVGEGNNDGHPRAETINRLKSVNSMIYTTIDNGSIQATIKPIPPVEETPDEEITGGVQPTSVLLADSESQEVATIEWFFEKSNGSVGVECTQGITQKTIKTTVIIKIRKEDFLYSDGYQVA